MLYKRFFGAVLIAALTVVVVPHTHILLPAFAEGGDGSIDTSTQSDVQLADLTQEASTLSTELTSGEALEPLQQPATTMTDTPTDTAAVQTDTQPADTTPQASEQSSGGQTDPVDQATTATTTSEVLPVISPELSTDKEDYHPGDTVSIFGKFFEALKTFTVKIFGSDLQDGNYTESEKQIVADANGNFSTTFSLDALFRPFYEMVASSLDGTQLAQGIFRDSAVGTYDQCSNDSGDGYGNPGSCQWTSGNIQANNSKYYEDDATVQRLWIEGFAPGSSHTVTLKYGTTKGGKHAYDFLTTWNHSENWITPADRCQGITNCASATDKQFNIPQDAYLESIKPGLQTPQLFTMRGIASGATAVNDGIISGTYAGDSETSVTLSFTVDSQGSPMCTSKQQGQQTVWSCSVALWFGAHVSSQADWDAGNSAVNISGSPYHVALDAVDGSSVGQRDNQMQAATIAQTGSITIIKDAVPNDAQDFSFTTTGGLTPASFSLDDDSNNTLSNTRTFTGLSAGTYTVTEGATAGWSLTGLACVDPTTNTTVTGSTATINLASGEAVTCTYTNTLQQGTLIVKKHVVNDNGGLAAASAFTLHVKNGSTDVSGSPAAGSESGTTYTLSAGTYTVSENTPISGYAQTGFSGDCDSSGNVTVVVGQTKTCTITNDDIQPKLTVTKVVVNNNGGSKQVSDFPLFVNTTGVTSGVQNGFNAGSYTVSETNQSGYLGTISGDCAANGAVTLAAGDVKSCTITNDDIAPKLHLRKLVTNDNGGSATVTDFTLTANGTGSNDLSGTSPVDSGTGLQADTFALSETNLPGYTPSAWSCIGGSQSGSSVTLGIGQEATCTIINDDQQAYLIVNKTVVNDNGGTAAVNDFNLTVDHNAVLDEVAYPVNPGLHTAGETNLPGYQAGTWGGDCATDGTVTLALGQTKTCTITNNDIAPSLTLVKVVTNNNGGTASPTDWTLTASGTTPISGAGGTTSGATFKAGTYTLSESAGPSGYAPSAWSCVKNSGTPVTGASITLGLADTATCTITNDDIQPTLTLIKHVINDNGGTLQVADFPLFVGTTSVVSGAANGFDAGTYTASETNKPGYAASGWTGDCASNGSVTLSVGQTKTCEITNNDIAPTLTIVKDADPNDLQDFAFSGTLGTFLLDDDQGVVGADNTLSNTKTFSNLIAGAANSITETEPNQYWVLKGISCIDNNTQAPFDGIVSGGTVTATLALDQDVTCTFTNEKLNPTRTQGFWQTHTVYTRSISTLVGGIKIGDVTTHKAGTGSMGSLSNGQTTGTSELFGAYFSNIAQKTTGKGKTAQRSDIDKARMQLLQQLVTAKLNCAAFGCTAAVQTMIANADAAYATGTSSAILISAGQLDAYNNSGDTLIIGNAGSATPQLSKQYANLTFWDTP